MMSEESNPRLALSSGLECVWNVIPLIRFRTLKYLTYTIADAIFKTVTTWFDPAEDGRRFGSIKSPAEIEVDLDTHLHAETRGKNGSVKFQMWDLQELEQSDFGFQDEPNCSWWTESSAKKKYLGDGTQVHFWIVSKNMQFVRFGIVFTGRKTSFQDESRKRRQHFRLADLAFIRSWLSSS